MTVLIGITQAPKETEKYICMEFKGFAARTIVGPFQSPEQASGWMEFMKVRADEYQEIKVPAQPVPENQWYGFAFELIETKLH